jgi:monofunctional biosynthetic peptidoglycan transglycosylase
MQKRLLLIPLIFLSLWLLFSGYILSFYFFHNVEKLQNLFPVYVESEDRFQFTNIKPKDWVSLNQISTYGKWAIVLSEDWAFYEHEGIDLNQLKTVIEESIKERKLGRGASTITQQLIKNIYLTDERSIIRKVKEILLALKAEKFLMKNKILEHYLNIAQFGDGIYGINLASRHYFKKSPKNLLPHEAAFLAMLLPSPIKYSYSFKRKSLSVFARNTINKILYKMKVAKIISEQEMYYYQTIKLGFEID